MDFTGKLGNSSISFRYNADREELEDLYDASEDDPPTPRNDVTPSGSNENTSQKIPEKSSSILDKYFKTMKTEKVEDPKELDPKNVKEEITSTPKKDVTSSPMKDYLNRLSKRSTNTDINDGAKENETWKIFHDFKNKISQAVEDIKSSRSIDDKTVQRDNSISDSEENSLHKDSDLSVGDTDNQAPSLDSSIQNLSEMSEAMTTKVNDINLTQSSITEDTPTPKDADKTLDSTLPDIDTGVEALEEYDIETNTDSSCAHGICQRKFATVPLPLQRIDSAFIENARLDVFTVPTIMLTLFLVTATILFSISHVLTGFVFGVWVLNLVQKVAYFVLDIFGYSKQDLPQTACKINRQNFPRATPAYTIPSIKEHKPMSKYQGWVNQYKRPTYNPFEYNINKTVSAFMKIEGNILRMSYTKSRIPKKALSDEKIDKVLFSEHCIYNLIGAKVILQPKGIIRKRQWSKKYPICIILNEKEDYQVLEREKNLNENTDTKEEDAVKNDAVKSSPTQKKKINFIWTKNEKGERMDLAGFKKWIKEKQNKEKTTEASTSVKPKESELKTDAIPQNLKHVSECLSEIEKLQLPMVEDEHWSVRSKSSSDVKLFIFARTGRDKYDWYRLLSAAAQEKGDQTPVDETEGSVHTERDTDSVAFTSGQGHHQPESNWEQTNEEETNWKDYGNDFWPYLYRYVQMYKRDEKCECGNSLWWFNTLVSRVFYDALRSKDLHVYLQTKVQKKLATLKVPSFTGELRVTSLSLGDSAPAFLGVHSIDRDARGVWVRLHVKYKSNARITLTTSINLRKLNEVTALEDPPEETMFESDLLLTKVPRPKNKKRAAVFNSDVEDSGESSSEEDSGEGNTATQSEGGGSSTKKILKMVDKITTSKYFQQISDYKYVKKAVQGLSNTDIKVQMELRELEGILNVNLPDPPHDRLWLGFEEKPQVTLKATAILGARPLRLAQLTGWIEQKLLVEMHRAFVMPNMEDFVINGLAPTPVEFE